MATNLNTSYIPVTFKILGGGLNSTSGPLGLNDTESSDLQNIEFNKFGSVMQRNGYEVLNTNILSGTTQGLYWYNAPSSQYAITVNQGRIYKMDNLDGTWDNISGAISLGGFPDSYAKLLLHCDGTDQLTTLTDSTITPKTAINTITHDSYTVLMLHADGTNGDTTISDSSISSKTVTNTIKYDTYTKLLIAFDGVDGSKADYTAETGQTVSMGTTLGNDAQLDTAQKEFGSASLLLNGTTDYVTVPDSADWDFGTGAFTVDTWFRATNFNIRKHIVGTGLNTWGLSIDNSATIRVWYHESGAANFIFTTSNLSTSAWHHLAVTRTGNDLSVFINGTKLGASQDVTGISFNRTDGRPMQIGSYDIPAEGFFGGWIDEFRISKGICRWVNSFTVPQSPYGQVATYTDQKKFGTASAYFDGQGSYITLADSADWSMAAGNFTFSCWMRLRNINTNQILFAQSDNPYDANNRFELSLTSANQLRMFWVVASTTMGNYVTTSAITSLDTNTWYHVAFERITTDGYIYVNGVSQGLTTGTAFGANNLGNFTGTLCIGSDAQGVTLFDGYMDEIRVSKGLARWNTNFNPPTSAYGQVTVTTDYKKFGSGGAEFKGYERIAYADSADWYFGAGDFTLSFWVNFNQLANQQCFLGQYEDANNYWFCRKNSSTSGHTLHMQFMDGGVTIGEAITNTWSPLTNQWYHITFTRYGALPEIYINGIMQANASATSFAAGDVGDMAGTLEIGQQNNADFYNGYLDEMRISKGITRWTSDFTPPDVEYAGYFKQDFDTFMNYVVAVDPVNGPWTWYENNGTASALTTITGLEGAKFIKKYQNYLFIANVTIGGIRYPNRIYWSDILSITSWKAYNYIDIARNDGDQISGIRELGDRLVIYKRNSIYVVIFTGDGDIPFVVQRTNSAVGCVAPFSIQTVENGHVFCAYDGIYYFDGSNSYKMSDKITDTFLGVHFDEMENASSLYQQVKNRYLLSCPSGTSAQNNFVLGWNSYLNSWTKYTGMSASSMAIFLVNDVEERPYFSDYLGYTYRMDYGVNDYPTGTKTAIDSYWYSNWKAYDTLCDRKGVPHIYLALRNETSTVLTLNYAYDFYNGSQYTHTFSAASTMSVTSHTMRRDLIGRGRFVRIGFAHNDTDTSYRLDGLGTFVTREGMV